MNIPNKKKIQSEKPTKRVTLSLTASTKKLDENMIDYIIEL